MNTGDKEGFGLWSQTKALETDKGSEDRQGPWSLMMNLNHGSWWLTIVADKEYCIQHNLFAFIMDPCLSVDPWAVRLQGFQGPCPAPAPEGSRPPFSCALVKF